MSDQQRCNGSKEGGAATFAATFLCAAAFAGGIVLWKLKRRSRRGESSRDEQVDSETTKRPAAVEIKGAVKAGKRSGSSKKMGKAARAEEKARRAEKRERHMKDSAVEHARKEDDGNNALYVNYTYHTGGRRDTANDVFGGQAIYKK